VKKEDSIKELLILSQSYSNEKIPHITALLPFLRLNIDHSQVL